MSTSRPPTGTISTFAAPSAFGYVRRTLPSGIVVPVLSNYITLSHIISLREKMPEDVLRHLTMPPDSPLAVKWIEYIMREVGR